MRKYTYACKSCGTTARRSRFYKNPICQFGHGAMYLLGYAVPEDPVAIPETPQAAMNARRVARKTFMKRIARRKPMLDIDTITEAFRSTSAANDELSHNDFDTKADRHLARATFTHSEGSVDIYVYSDGFYEALMSTTYRLDVAQVFACWQRANNFVSLLQVKQRIKT